jgi:Sel1 repeat-containing protein
MKRLVFLILVCLSVAARAETTYTYDMKNGLAPWISWMPVEKTADGVRMTLPGKLDINHLDGIGPLWLLAHLPTMGAGGPGFVDLDQAEVSIRFRAQDLDLKGARIVWWVTRQLPKEEAAPDYEWQETNWALTCCDLAKSLSEKWSTVTVRIDTDPSRWTYGGTNWMQLGDYGGRYVEYPLSKVVKGTAGTLHLAIVGTNASRPPTGKIEISRISLRTKRPGIPLSVEDMTPLMRAQAWDAVRWHLSRLMPTDNPVVNYHYGRLLVTGLGGPLDYEKGAVYLQKGYALPEARYELAKLYFYGLGVDRNPAKAVEILQATTANIDACELLGRAYAYGIGVAPNKEKATPYFRYAAERGNAIAMAELAKRLTDNDPAEAYYWYRLSVKRLNPADVGASRVDMEKWSIGKLKQILPQEVITAEDDLIEQFVAKK